MHLQILDPGKFRAVAIEFGFVSVSEDLKWDMRAEG